MERRRTRSQVAIAPMARGLNPAYFLLALAVGLFFGLGVGLKDQVFAQGMDRDESYLVLASTLYGQDPTAEVAASLRRRLTDLGFANPSLTVLKLSDRFAASRDRERQREAEGLRIFGEALGIDIQPTAVAQNASTPEPTPVPTAPVLALGPEVLPSASPSAEPAPAATPAPDPNEPVADPNEPVADPPAEAAAEPTATVQPTPQGTPAKTKSADKQPVVLRKEPSTQSSKVALIPVGAKVQVLATVNGKASDPGIDPKELRWYHVRFNNLTGYVYYKLIDLN